MNSILKRLRKKRKKKKQEAVPSFAGLTLERYCHSKNSKPAMIPTGGDPLMKKQHFLKLNILNIINKYIYWESIEIVAILCHYKTQGHHLRHLQLNESLKEHKVNWYFMLKIADNHKACICGCGWEQQKSGYNQVSIKGAA